MPEQEEKMKYPLSSVYFYLTEGCNLCCRHCWIQPKFQTDGHEYPTLDFKIFESIIEEAKPLGLASVKLTGGEPLLHPQIYDIVDLVRSEDLRLIVETNGTLCTAELARKMSSCRNPFVSVSLDGANAETHEWMRGVEGCFDAAIEGTRNLVAAGFRPQFVMSLVQRNRNQIMDVVRLAESLGCGSIKFNIVQPTARGEQLHDRGEALSLEELVELGTWVEKDLSTKTCVRLFFSHPLVFRPLGRMFGEGGCGCTRCAILHIIGVLADGSYAMCGIGETVPELVYGHASRDSLEDVWNNNPMIRELREGLPNRFKGICSECTLRDICLGYCVAQNYYMTKDVWSCYWYCDLAMRKGLFPMGRLLPGKHEEARIA